VILDTNPAASQRPNSWTESADVWSSDLGSFPGNTCTCIGTVVDIGELNKQKDSVTLDPQGRPLVYLVRLRRTGLAGLAMSMHRRTVEPSSSTQPLRAR
jgi:hypothetical protein